jgi:hypothetical protein
MPRARGLHETRAGRGAGIRQERAGPAWAQGRQETRKRAGGTRARPGGRQETRVPQQHLFVYPLTACAVEDARAGPAGARRGAGGSRGEGNRGGRRHARVGPDGVARAARGPAGARTRAARCRQESAGLRSKSFEPWPSLHVAHTYSLPPPRPPPRRARQEPERPCLLMLFCRHLVCRSPTAGALRGRLVSCGAGPGLAHCKPRPFQRRGAACLRH